MTTTPTEGGAAVVADYLVVEESYPTDLAQKVREWIKRGWQPLGGLSVTKEYGRSIFAQAMVKYVP